MEDVISAFPDVPTTFPSAMTTPALEGQWIGHTYIDKDCNTNGMTVLEFGKPSGEGHFEGRGYIALAPFTVSGTIEPSETSGFKITFTKTYEDNDQKICEGKLDGTTNAINGTWYFTDDTDEGRDARGPLYLIRMPASLYRFRYTSAQFSSNPARARWRFACDAVLYQVRQRFWSWKFMKARCVERRRFIYLWTNSDHLPSVEAAEYKSLNQKLAASDNSLYCSIGDHRNTKHL
jgi:hypothetical protein